MNAATAVQRPLFSIERTRALVSLETVISELVDYDEDEVLVLIFEHFALGPAWNVASRNATRRELRVLMKCVRFFKEVGGNRPQPKIARAELLDLILPGHNKPFFTGIELQAILNCKGSHVINLIEERSLAVMPGTTWQRGRGGSPVVSRASTVAFLKTRQEL